MKKLYTSPAVEMQVFDAADVIATSGEPGMTINTTKAATNNDLNKFNVNNLFDAPQ